MEFNPRFNVGDTVYWVTNLVVPCDSCGHFTTETRKAVWSGKVVSVMFERTKHMPLCDHSHDDGIVVRVLPPDFDEFVQYQVRPDGEHKAGNVVLDETSLVATEVEAQTALDRLNVDG